MFNKDSVKLRTLGISLLSFAFLAVMIFRCLQEQGRPFGITCLVSSAIAVISVLSYTVLAPLPWKLFDSAPFVNRLGAAFVWSLLLFSLIVFATIRLDLLLGMKASFSKTFDFQYVYQLPILLAVGFFVARWEIAETHLAEVRSTANLAQQLLMQTQLAPHVLFNSLNSIVAINRRDPNEGTTSILNLSLLMRGLLNATEREFHTIKEEKTLVKHYLDIERLRLRDRLVITEKWDETINDFAFPPLVIQTLVENAIKHGISTHPRGGELLIQVENFSNYIKATISNTGNIFTGKKGNGIGIRNLTARLLHVNGTFKIHTSKPWTIAEVTIPFSFSSPVKSSFIPVHHGKILIS